jgi:sarcosine oxidase subunit alpha
MSQKDRLGTGGRVNRAIPLTFTFNGRTYQGFQGDTLASALLANGVHFVARSFKYHRPRGIVTADVAEPNAVVQLETGPYTVPNARATEIELYQGLVATSVNAQPSLEHDKYAINQKLSRFMPAGFYYKTFMWPRNMWPKYERRSARPPASARRRTCSTPTATTSATRTATCSWSAAARRASPPRMRPRRPARA